MTISQIKRITASRKIVARVSCKVTEGFFTQIQEWPYKKYITCYGRMDFFTWLIVETCIPGALLRNHYSYVNAYLLDLDQKDNICHCYTR